MGEDAIDPHRHGDAVCGLKADAKDVVGEAVRVLPDDGHRAFTVHTRTMRAAKAGVTPYPSRKTQNVAGGPLLFRRCGDHRVLLGTDPFHFEKALGSFFPSPRGSARRTWRRATFRDAGPIPFTAPEAR